MYKEKVLAEQLSSEMQVKNAEIEAKNEQIANLIIEVAEDFDSLDTSISEIIDIQWFKLFIKSLQPLFWW